MEKIINLEKEIVPSFIKYDKKMYKILSLKEPNLVIKKYKVILNEDKLESLVLIDSKHPNCDPKNNKFCLPSSLINENFNEVKEFLEKHILPIYWADDCYFCVWGLVDYLY